MYLHSLGDSMITKIQKWGNSLTLRIPKKIADEVNVEPGSMVDIAVQDGRLIISPANSRKCDLDELLAEVTPNNRHDEIDWGDPVGREVW